MRVDVAVIRVVRTSSLATVAGPYQEELEQLIACGVGPSQKPTCTPAFTIRRKETGTKAQDAALAVTIGADHTIDVTGDPAALTSANTGDTSDTTKMAGALGRHALVFP